MNCYSLLPVLVLLVVLAGCSSVTDVKEGQGTPVCAPSVSTFCSDAKTLSREVVSEDCNVTTSSSVCDYACDAGRCMEGTANEQAMPPPAPEVPAAPAETAVVSNDTTPTDVLMRMYGSVANSLIYPNVEYAKVGNRSLYLDIFLPKSAKKPMPVVVYIHGGAWMAGSKEQCLFDVAPKLVEAGIAVVCVNYRLSNVAIFPANIHDVKSSIRWVRANADKYGFDPNRIGAAGHSAGGHLAALLGTSGGVQYLEGNVGVTGYSSKVIAVMDMSGPTDLIRSGLAINPKVSVQSEKGVLEWLLGGRLPEKNELAKNASPTTYVSSDDPVFLIMHGKKDDVVAPNQSIVLADLLNRSGVPVELRLLEDTGHLINSSVSQEAAADFFKKNLVSDVSAAGISKNKPSPSLQKTGIVATGSSYRDIEYAKVGDVSLKLDAYIPDSGKKPFPVIVFIHGGGWMSGDKSACLADLSAMPDLGFALVCVNYRLSDVAKFPAQIHDVKSSIRWIRANAGKYGFDKDNIGAIGVSAGGHLTALLGTSGSVSELEGTVGVTGYSSRIQAAYDLFGPTDFVSAGIADITDKGASFYEYHAAAESLLGGPIDSNKGLAESANPIKYVSSDDPPFYLVHGKQDRTVPYNQSVILEAALKKAGVPVTFKLVEDGGHAPNIISVEAAALDFFGKHLKDASK